MRKRYQNFVMKFGILTLILFVSLATFGSITSSFSCDATSGCSPLVVNVTDHSSGNITTWHWDLGNGNTSTQRNPSATYLNPGVYTIKLITSNGTISDSTTHTVTVYGRPVVDFVCDKVSACTNDSIHFNAQVTPGSAAISQYAWGFGNGIASSTINPIYKYSTPGSYDVTLVVQDSNGCIANVTKPSYIKIWASPSVACTVTPAVSCGTSQSVTFASQSAGTGLTYSWNFGDSTTSNQAGPSHTYQYGKYKSILTVTNTYGCKSSIAQNVAVINLIADFSADKITACAGEEITFYSQSPMQGVSWSWNFGDGGSSNKQNPKHIYNNPGVYSVTFVIKDAICKDSTTKIAYIHITQGFAVSFDADHKKSCTTPFAVNFTSQVSTPVTYLWNFGNGVTDTSANPSTVYNTSSTFSVTLTAIDSNGCTVVSAIPGMISTSKPWTKFLGDTLVCPGAPVKFTNKSLYATHYLWHFGDGDTSTALSPTHVYRTFGNYDVSLTAIDSFGCDSTLVKHSFVHVDSAQVDFRVDETFSMCPPLVSVFRSITNRPDLKLTWDFGDGYTDTAANPTHIFFHPGIYTVKLIGRSKQGCTDTITYPNLIVVQGPSGSFHLTPNNGCIPLVVNFSGSTSANTQSITCDLGDGRLYTDSLNFNYTYNAVRTYHPKFILTDHIGCTVPYDLDSIITHPLPLLHLGDTSICAGQVVRMVLGADHYSWVARVCDTCGRIPDVTDTLSVAALTPEVTTTYTVTATKGKGCSTTDHFRINVVPLPATTTHDTIKLCKNETTRLNALQADSVRWSPATYLSSPVDMAPTCTATASIVYTVTAYNSLGCSSSQQVPVKVIDRVTVALSPDTTVCPGSQVQLRVSAIDSSIAGVSYTWSQTTDLDNGGISTPTAQMHTQTETFQVITRSGGCTPDTSMVMVKVTLAASVKVTGTVTTTPHAEIPLAVVSGDLTSYEWTAKDSLVCKDCRSTTLIPLSTQVVYLNGTNQYGCPASDSVMINVLQCDPASIFVPNTFTPNGDGLHDILYFHSRTLAQLESFRVFDRWGSMVYEGKSVSEGWDGTISGSVAEQGVYIYTVTGKCDSGYDVQASGTVTLIR
jgi:gliding motility-associated-like protein